MSAAKGMHGYGTYIAHAVYDTAHPLGADAVGAGFTALAEVISINGVPVNHSVTEVTHLLSDDWAKEKIPGFADGGQLSFKFNYEQTILAALAAISPASDRTAPGWGRREWCVQFPDGGQWSFTGFVQGNPFTVEEDNRVTVECTIEISGAPTFTASA